MARRAVDVSGYFRAPRELWPAVADGLPLPWLDEWVEMDCAYWAGEAEREVKGYRSALPMRGRRKLTAPFCATRWGWSEHHARKALRRFDPMRSLLSSCVDSASTQDEETKRKKVNNKPKPFKNLSREIDSASAKVTTRASDTDLIPQTTDPIPPIPPKGDTEPAMVSAVRSAMALDPMHLNDSAWLDCHPLADVWAMARAQGTEAADELRETMLAQRPTEPMSPEQVLAVMRSQGWRGSGRLRDIARTCHELSQPCDQRQCAD